MREPYENRRKTEGKPQENRRKTKGKLSENHSQLVPAGEPTPLLGNQPPGWGTTFSRVQGVLIYPEMAQTKGKSHIWVTS